MFHRVLVMLRIPTIILGSYQFEKLFIEKIECLDSERSCNERNSVRVGACFTKENDSRSRATHSRRSKECSSWYEHSP